MILLLEDSDELSVMLQQMLEWRGHDVLCAGTGSEGIRLLETAETLPKLIICDMVMPDMDGHEFLKRVREHPEWSGIPVIVMSGSDSSKNAQDALAYGASGYLSKPFGIEDLDQMLGRGGLAE